MKTLNLICLFSFLTITTIAQEQGSIKLAQQNTLKMMRDFRDNLNKGERNPKKDSLLERTALLISYAKTLQDASQLTDLKGYFTMATKSYETANSKQKLAVVENLNQDISFKINANSTGSELHLSPEAAIFEDVEVKVGVKINGQVPRADYVLYWTYFTGIDQDALVKAKSYVGNSVNFSNPCKLTIKLPGVVTFWLLETNTKKVFKCFPDHLKMVQKNNSIDMSFIPFNP
jgi:hypothetical protein